MLTIDRDYTIRVSRGDDAPIAFDIYDSTGALMNCTGASFKFTVKASIDDTQANAKIVKSSPLGSGIDITSAPSGTVTVYITAADLAPLNGTYQYDLQMTESGGQIRTVRQGLFIVRKDVTTT